MFGYVRMQLVICLSWFGLERLRGNQTHTARDDSGIGVLREQAAK
jgi:hypothetical protein